MMCSSCGKEKSEESFQLIRGQYRRSTCNTCRRRDRYHKNPESVRSSQRHRRQTHPETFVLIDTKSSDKKKGLVGNDLDREFVKWCLEQPCTYCGETSLRMTLDRKDNTKAHSKDNITPACIRCNMLRGSMPIDAWRMLAPAVRQVRESGLFGDWASQPLRRRNSK